MFFRTILFWGVLSAASSVLAQNVESGNPFGEWFDAGPCMTTKEAQEKVDLFDNKGKQFMEKNGVRDLRALFFLNINPDTDIRVVMDALGAPEEEFFEKTRAGTEVKMIWSSSTGKVLEIDGFKRLNGDYPKILRARYYARNTNDEDEMNTIRGNKKLLAEGRTIYYEHMLAVRCLEAMEKTRWRYEGKEMKGELAGWAGVLARFRAPNKILRSYDPRKFARDDQILLRSFLYSHVGLENDHSRMEKVKIWTAEETERRRRETTETSEN